LKGAKTGYFAEKIEIVQIRAQSKIQTIPNGFGIEVKGQTWGCSAQGRMIRFKSFGEPLDVVGCAGEAKVDVFGQVGTPEVPSRPRR